MNESEKSAARFPASFVATVGGVGRIGRAPGTLGSLIALPLAWAVGMGGIAGLLALSVLTFAIGWWASALYIRDGRIQDPPEVVIDEVAGQTLTLAFAPMPLGLPWIAAGFIAFRLFDIWKPWPVSLAERRLPGGLGIMADDIVAALYAGLALVVGRIILGA